MGRNDSSMPQLQTIFNPGHGQLYPTETYGCDMQ